MKKGYWVGQVKEIKNAEISIPLLKDRELVNGKVTVYVCRQGACLAPIRDALPARPKRSDPMNVSCADESQFVVTRHCADPMAWLGTLQPGPFESSQ